MTKFIPKDQEKVVEDAAIRNKRNEAIDPPTPRHKTQTLRRGVYLEQPLKGRDRRRGRNNSKRKRKQRKAKRKPKKEERKQETEQKPKRRLKKKTSTEVKAKEGRTKRCERGLVAEPGWQTRKLAKGGSDRNTKKNTYRFGRSNALSCGGGPNVVDITQEKRGTAKVQRGLRTLGAIKTGRRSEQRGVWEASSWYELYQQT